MKSLKEALFSRKNIIKKTPYGLTEKDLKGELKDFPIGVVVRMLEEQELQGNKPDIKVFQDYIIWDSQNGGFDWYETEAGMDFWTYVIREHNFDLFFEKYPEYAQYN